jgi:primase-polymerase (primpol)-like protein
VPKLLFARTNDSKTWGTLDQCLAVGRMYRTRIAGIGLVLGDGIFGVDLDNCVIDRKACADLPLLGPPAGVLLHPEAQRLMDLFDTYTEYSPSGSGLHLYGRGSMPPGTGYVTSVNKQKIEYFDDGSPKFFTFTGRHFAGTPVSIEDRQDVLTRWHSDTFLQQLAPAFMAQDYQDKNISSPEIPLDPKLAELMEQDAMSETESEQIKADIDGLLRSSIVWSTQGDKFTGLWDGDMSEYNNDHSAADMALCSIIAYWTRDKVQIDRLFRQSKLMREKWNRATYRNITIAKALKLTEREDAF